MAARSPTPENPFLSIHAVRVYVRDVDRSLSFYTQQLDFRVVIDTRLQSGERWVAVSPPDGTTILALVAPRPKTAEYKLIGRATQVVLVTSDVATKFQEWSRRGVRFLSTPRLRRIKYQREAASGEGGARLLGRETPVWGSVSARFRDIDGNVFSLVSFDELTHAVEAERHLASERLEAERRAARELEIAKEVQSRLFPQFLPPLSTLDYAGICIQARHVGGDYYDFLDLGSPQRLERGATSELAAAAWHMAFVLADICGKGIAGALLMANLQANLRSRYALALHDFPRLLQSVNQLFYENSPYDRFATMFFAVFDDHSGEMEYANCGHNAALLFRADGTLERLESTTTVIGLFPRWECGSRFVNLAPGDLLVVYSDGVTESLDHGNEEFGEERLIRTVRRHRERRPEALISAIVEEVRAFSPHEQSDDITLIVARRRAASADAVA
jgi:serine phosphatase RsbU (regulator of sigma subunit)/catechol 2,3-dioxygenase-like lactoylglutathione lyase family enzyme